MIGIGVVAHTTRSAQAEALALAVEADVLSVDDGTLGCEGNHAAVWEQLAELPTSWSVILEDDAQPIGGFAAQLYAALPMAPSPIVSLYLGRLRPRPWQPRIRNALAQAEQAGAHWIQSTRLLHAVGYAIRTDLLPSLLRYTSTRPVDEHISGWARQYGHPICYTVGSLVEHADEPTVIPLHPDKQPRTPGRKAWRLGGNDRWTTTTVTMR